VEDGREEGVASSLTVRGGTFSSPDLRLLLLLLLSVLLLLSPPQRLLSSRQGREGLGGRGEVEEEGGAWGAEALFTMLVLILLLLLAMTSAVVVVRIVPGGMGEGEGGVTRGGCCFGCLSAALELCAPRKSSDRRLTSRQKWPGIARCRGTCVWDDRVGWCAGGEW
jgi:hypothetical protein